MSTASALPCALITGASAGIGEAFARMLAARGMPLVLSARRADRLEALAAELRAAYPVRVEVIVCDLAAIDAAQQLHAEIRRRGLVVDTLINNAGYGLTGYFLSQPWSAQAEFLQVMVTAPSELCHRFLPDMRERGHGRIINVASLAGHVPGSAGQTLYAGAKSYLIKLSQALALEYGRDGVRVCALCPGFTWSEFHDVTGSRALMAKMPKWMWMTAEEVVEDGWQAIERGQVVRVPGRINRLIKLAFKWLPDRLALRLLAKRSDEFRLAEPSRTNPPAAAPDETK